MGPLVSDGFAPRDHALKICIAIEKFDPAQGGAERYCWDLAHFLAGQGHTLAIICMRARTPENDHISIRRVRPLRFPQGLRHLSFALLHYRAARTMRDYIHFGVGNTFFLDVYQPHGGAHKAWFKREIQRYPGRLRFAMHILKRLSLKDMVQRFLEWWTFTVTRPRVFAISDMVADDIRTGFTYPPERIVIIPNGIDTARFTPAHQARRAEIRARYGLGEDDFVFCFVANNFALKGFYVLVDACLSLGSTPFKILALGEPNYWAKAEAKLLTDTIVLAGKAADLEYIYPACDCLVHPTFYDACSLVVLEALAAGIPVITTSANGASMFVNGNGRIIPAGDPKALAKAMRAALSRQIQFMHAVGFQNHTAVFGAIETHLEAISVR